MHLHRHRTLTRSSCIWIFCIAALVAIIMICAFSPVLLWSGGYPLAVTLETGGVEPKWVYCDVAHSQKDFDRFPNPPTTPDDMRRYSETGIVREPYRGELINLGIRLDGRHNWILGELHDPQVDKFLLIIVAWPNGEFTRQVIEIPDYRKTRAITVKLP